MEARAVLRKQLEDACNTGCMVSYDSMLAMMPCGWQPRIGTTQVGSGYEQRPRGRQGARRWVHTAAAVTFSPPESCSMSRKRLVGGMAVNLMPPAKGSSTDSRLR